jgi:TrmH family RNA methyltransferase
MKRITSAANARFRSLRELMHSSRERKKSGLSVLDGPHLVCAYRDCVGVPEELIVSESGVNKAEVKAILASMKEIAPVLLSDALFNEISPVVTPTGVMAVVKTPRLQRPNDGMSACIMLDGVQDPGNLGSILRSAAAAGVRDVLLSETSVHAWSPRVLRAGMGAHFMLSVYEQADLREAIRGYKGRVLAAVRDGARSVYETDLTGLTALLFGSEGGGVSPELKKAAHEEVSIPMPGGGDSLNLAAAVAVCLFERVRQLSAISGQQSATSMTGKLKADG